MEGLLGRPCENTMSSMETSHIQAPPMHVHYTSFQCFYNTNDMNTFLWGEGTDLSGVIRLTVIWW